MYMIMLVLNNPGRLDELLAAWESAGITGATIIESTGIHRVMSRRVPMRFFFQATGEPIERGNYTLFAIVDSQSVVETCLAVTEHLIGDLNQPDTGVFAAWPLILVKGVPQDNPPSNRPNPGGQA